MFLVVVMRSSASLSRGRVRRRGVPVRQRLDAALGVGPVDTARVRSAAVRIELHVSQPVRESLCAVTQCTRKTPRLGVRTTYANHNRDMGCATTGVACDVETTCCWSARCASAHARTAVDGKQHASDEARLVRGEEQCGIGHVPAGPHVFAERHPVIASGRDRFA